jgi:hypothetical protein
MTVLFGPPTEAGRRTVDRTAADLGGPRISVAIMHHPARRDSARALARSLARLSPRVVADPDPSGPASPLRTAKRAWREVDESATHHLVLQDDTVVCEGFEQRLRAAVRARPDEVITLYVNADSPNNSYPVRHAVFSGSPWALLVPGEFVPTVGLLMPVTKARELADFLARIPDELCDDDAFVDLFCRTRDYRVLATVPNLVEHRGDRSVASNDGHGVRRSVAFLPDWTPPPSYWQHEPAIDKGASMRAAGTVGVHHIVTVVAAACFVRFICATAEHPVRQPCASWYSVCAMLGVPPARVLADLEAYLGSPAGAEVAALLRTAEVAGARAVELWAAGFLLGMDSGGTGAQRRCAGDLARRLRALAIAGWVDSGFVDGVSGELRGPVRDAFVSLGLSAVESGAGWVDGRAEPREDG